MKVADPFHLFYNTFKAQDWAVLLSAVRTCGMLKQLQFWMFENKLAHLDLSPDTDLYARAWQEWIQAKAGRDSLEKPVCRSDLNGMECKVVFAAYPEIVAMLPAAPREVLLEVCLSRRCVTIIGRCTD